MALFTNPTVVAQSESDGPVISWPSIVHAAVPSLASKPSAYLTLPTITFIAAAATLHFAPLPPS